MAPPRFMFWSKNEFFPQASAAPSLVVDDKIISFFTRSPFCTPDLMVVLEALRWRRILSEAGFPDIDAFPGHSGEILVSAVMDNVCFEVTVEPDFSLNVSFERGDNLIFSYDKISIEAANEKLLEAVREIWISSVGFIRAISTP